ncbi:hypothetical protein TPHA_0G02310 [Tetrapisispora phaffii CBS 4417]|uniref:Uncharacterized protein n=1 Tax=Tetrapisispora phaffii (strain ATCC 24235 / CBS 4417 / NBRC 1672 / NRRL Y-8282 / UCD 70-5) TaxID=1071381 RepID=G8BVY9_TETPH|nr:hypothetical protein TPHA_0G02310 [Tetrapisispora phaffii CBS 4417]CCE64067.1 hypothetical protein TPHA_0G02310 [Tetrapisispora phaffii CBS 4417]
MSSSSVSSRSSVSTNSRLVSTGVVAASSVSATSSASRSVSSTVSSHSSSHKSTKTSNSAPSNVVGKPLSWKYATMIGAVVVGSFALSAGL